MLVNCFPLPRLVDQLIVALCSKVKHVYDP